MDESIAAMKGEYENGRMSRREFLRYCTLLGTSMAAATAFGRPMARADGEGTAIVYPGGSPVMTWGTQLVVYTIGSSGIAEGGGLKIQFPQGWHRARIPLSLDPAEPYYVSATTSAPGAEIGLSVAHVGIDGDTDATDWTSTLTVQGQALEAGDEITYAFGDQSGGGRGVRAGKKAGLEYVRIFSDSDGDGSYEQLANLPHIETLAEPADKLTVVAPSVVAQGAPFELAVVAQDRYYNADDSYTGTVTFASTDSMAELPDPYTFTPTDAGIKTFTVTLHTTGAHWITVTDAVLTPAGVDSNPIDCRVTVPSLQLHWGDIHSHTESSKDASGLPELAFQHARDVARLDFYATTDHSYLYGTEYTPLEWETTRQLVNLYYQPGSFVTFLAYEWTISAPYGHHCVYFRGTGEQILRGKDYPTLPDLWAALEGKEALTIPHHTGKIFATGDSKAVDWSYGNAEHQTTVEIYSKQGLSEYYDPDHPLSYDNVSPHGGASIAGPHYARDAWAVGQQLGVIASTDDHSAIPGQPHRGLAAVYAENLAREDIFDAIAARHTYGTTGQRILLDFKVDGHMMGDSYTVPLPHSPVIEVRVVGTDLLESVEVMKYDGITYTVPYSVTAPGSREASFTFVDPDFNRAGLYYVRVEQVNEVEERTVMAWSSPVWVSPILDKRSYLPLVVKGAD